MRRRQAALRPSTAMMGILRRVTRDQLLAHLESIPVAPFHWLRWNDEPLRLEEARQRAQAADPGAHFYVRGEHIFGPLDSAASSQ